VRVVVLCSLPGAGKSSWCAANLEQTHVVVSKDRMKSARRKQDRQARELRAALAAGSSVVVDNTNLTVADRAAIVVIAQEFGAPVGAILVEAPLATCLERNAARVGTACVPEGILRGMARRLEPPTLAEGFVEVRIVVTVG
jgi:predicted kinase